MCAQVLRCFQLFRRYYNISYFSLNIIKNRHHLYISSIFQLQDVTDSESTADEFLEMPNAALASFRHSAPPDGSSHSIGRNP